MKVDKILFILVILYYKSLHMVLGSGGYDETIQRQDESHTTPISSYLVNIF